MAKLKIGKGWFVLLTVGGLWAVNHYAPGVTRPVKDAAGGLLDRVPFLHRATPAPATATPTPFVAPSAAPASSPTPEASPEASPDTTPEAAPTPEPTPDPATPDTDATPGANRNRSVRAFPDAGRGEPQIQETAPGSGAEASVGATVTVRFSASGGLPVDATFMVGAYEVAPGLDRGVRGLRVGGKRHLSFSGPLADGPLPGGSANGSVECDIELVAVGR